MRCVDPEPEVQVLDLGWARTRAHTHTHFKVMFEQSFLQAAQNTKALPPPPKQVGSALDSMMALIACLRAFNLAASWKLLRHLSATRSLFSGCCRVWIQLPSSGDEGCQEGWL